MVSKTSTRHGPSRARTLRVVVIVALLLAVTVLAVPLVLMGLGAVLEQGLPGMMS